MKTLDLNIKLDEKVMKQVTKGRDKEGKPIVEVVEASSAEVAVNWLLNMVERAINKPRVASNGQLVPTVEVTFPIQKAYARLVDALESHKDGVVNMEDEVFDFLNRKFHQAEISVQRDVNRILVRLDDAINKATTA